MQIAQLMSVCEVYEWRGVQTVVTDDVRGQYDCVRYRVFAAALVNTSGGVGKHSCELLTCRAYVQTRRCYVLSLLAFIMLAPTIF